jgi:hypothetical protein
VPGRGIQDLTSMVGGVDQSIGLGLCLGQGKQDLNLTVGGIDQTNEIESDKQCTENVLKKVMENVSL